MIVLPRAGCHNGAQLHGSFAVSTLVLCRQYARYFEAQEKYGVRSVESRKASNPVAFGIIGLIAVFAAIFLVVFKGVTL